MLLISSIRCILLIKSVPDELSQASEVSQQEKMEHRQHRGPSIRAESLCSSTGSTGGPVSGLRASARAQANSQTPPSPRPPDAVQTPQALLCLKQNKNFHPATQRELQSTANLAEPAQANPICHIPDSKVRVGTCRETLF